MRIKGFLLSIFLGLIIISCKKKQDILNSTAGNIQYVINENAFDWRINPKLSPDRLRVECEDKTTAVKFVSDIDTINFNISLGDTIQFNVLYNNTKALTEIVGIPKNVNFTEEYIKENNGKFNVKIPEVHELANIMVAISKIGRIDSNLVDMRTSYYKQVQKHFLKYKNHPAIDTINNHIVELHDEDGYWYYYALKMNACGYLFNEQDEIVDDDIITMMGFDNPEDPFVINKELFANFAKTSGFRKFYSEHQNYYHSLISTYKELNPIDKMQEWLETIFGFEYGNYLVTFSPLVGGSHATQKFEDNGFKQTVMFVARAWKSDKYNDNVNEMLNSRVVFTEIDHNFVNPVSANYSKDIEKVFKNREKWVAENVNGTSAYSSPEAVFNEYMTYAFFSLYCMDNFPKKDVEIYMPLMENMMANRRGFIKFKEFNQEMMSFYQKASGITVDKVYWNMLKWSEVN